MVLCQGVEVKLELMKQEADTSGLKMHGADGGRLTLPQASAAAAADAGTLDDAPAAEDSDSDSDTESIISDAESSTEKDESLEPQ